MYYIRSYVHHMLVGYFKSRELDELYLSIYLRTFAESFVALFIPIYLLELGYSLQIVLFYFLLCFVLVVITMPLGMFLNRSLGVKKTMVLGTVGLICLYYTLHLVSVGFPYYIVALIHGCSLGVYFSAFNIELTKASIKRAEGRELSFLKVIVLVSASIGPVVGAIIASQTSFHVVFLVVSLFLIISVIPLFLSKDFFVHYHWSLRDMFRADSKRKAVMYQAHGFLTVASEILWPIFIYFTIKNIVSLGIMVTVSSFLIILFIMYVGKIADTNDKKLLSVGIFSYAPFWIIRLFLLSPIGLFISQFIGSFLNAMIDIAISKMVYQKAEHDPDIGNYFLFRELHLGIGRIILLSIAIVTNSLTPIFVLAFFVTFLYFVVEKEMK